MSTSNDPTPGWISYEDLVARVSRALDGELRPGVVELATRALVEGHALGNPRFGLGLLAQLGDGARLDAPVMVEQTGGRVVLDGSGCFGPTAMAEAVLILRETAREHGIAIVAVRSLGGMGRLAPFVEAAAESGLLTISGATSSPAVAPHGGHAPFVGTNPMAVGLPTTTGRPFVLDIASSAATMAEIHRARDEGTPLPTGVAVDADGEVTVDPNALAAVLPRGELLGTMVGLLVEAMTSGVTGEPPVNTARTVTLIGVGAASDAGGILRKRLAEAGGREPGARSREVIDRARRDGLTLAEDTWQVLTRLSP